MKPQRVYAELRRVLPPETIVTLDAGAAPAYGYDRLSFGRPRTFLTPLDLGGLGFAFPVALGAKLGRPDVPVLAVHGDGGFLMNAQEIETAVRHGIAVVTLVMNNNCWGSEKAYQKHFYNERYIGCDIGNPRYDEYARLFPRVKPKLWEEVSHADGLVLSGEFREKHLVEIIEYPDHPWYLGVQFHPEFKSKPLAAHPLFRGFVRAAVNHKGISEGIAAGLGRTSETPVRDVSKDA